MDDIRQTAIDRFRAYLERRQFSAHTLVSYTLDLHVFFMAVTVPLAQVSFREVDDFVESQHQHGRAWATINRRLNALKHFFDFCLEQQFVGGNPVKPSHLVAYLRLADKYLGLLASRLRGVNQPVIRTRRGFQPLVTHRWPAFERKVSAPNLSPPT